MQTTDKEQKVLFDVDDSESSRQAVASAGALLKNMENLNVTIFHGAPDRDLSFLSRLLRLTPDAAKEYQKICSLEEQRVLEQAEKALIDSGFEEDRVATLCEGKCHDPAAAVLRLATAEGFETVVPARSITPRLERAVMGSATLRLVQLAYAQNVWVIDPPIVSRDVLVPLVGAPISRRVVEHAVRYFSHLKESKFTFFHVIPALPPQFWDQTRILNELEREEQEERTAQWMKAYEERVSEVAELGKERLLKAGIPAENVSFRVQALQRGMARDILTELAEGNYGVLVIGRKGSREISPFRLGAVAGKLLHHARGCIICLVN